MPTIDPKKASDTAEVIDTLIAKAAAGADAARLSVIITDKLSEKFSKAITEASIKLDTIDLNTVIKTALAGVQTSTAAATEKFNRITDDILIKVSKGLEDFKISNTSAGETVSQKNLFDIIFKLTPEYNRSSSQIYQELVKKTLAAVTTAVDTFTINSFLYTERITQKDLISTILKVTPEFSISSNLEYQNLVKKTLTTIAKATDKFTFSSEKDISTQKDLFNVIFRTTPEFNINSANQYQKLVQDTLLKLTDNVNSSLKFSADTNISQQDIFNVIFRSTPEFTNQTRREYQVLAQSAINVLRNKVSSLELEGNIQQEKILDILFDKDKIPDYSLLTSRTYQQLVQKSIDALTKQVDKFVTTASLIESVDNPTQQWLVDTLFNQTPEMGIFSTWSFNKLRMDVLDMFKDQIKSFKLRPAGEDSMSQQDVIDILFKTTPEMGIFSTWEFNKLRIKALKILSDGLTEVEDKYKISLSGPQDSMSQQNVIDLLFKQTPEMGIFSTWEFNRLRMTAMKILETGLEGLKIEKDTKDKLTQKDVITDILFKQTPEMGFIASLWFDVQRNKVMSKLKEAFEGFTLEDEGKDKWTRQDLLNLLFKQTPEMGILSTWSFNKLRMDVINKFRDSLNIETATAEEKNTKSSFLSEISKTEKPAIPEVGIAVSLVKDTIKKLAIAIKTELIGPDDPDLLTFQEQKQLTSDVVKKLDLIANRILKMSSATSTKDSSSTNLSPRRSASRPARSGRGLGRTSVSGMPSTARAARPSRAPSTVASIVNGGKGLKTALSVGKSLGKGVVGLAGGYALDKSTDILEEKGYKKAAAGTDILSSVLTGASIGGMAGAPFAGIGAVPGAIAGGVAGLGYGLWDKGKQLIGADEPQKPVSPTLSPAAAAASLPAVKSNTSNSLTEFLAPQFRTLGESLNRIEEHLKYIPVALSKIKPSAENSTSYVPLSQDPAMAPTIMRTTSPDTIFNYRESLISNNV